MEKISFPVYRDDELGLGELANQKLIELEVDEDYESTNSIIEHGKRLCEFDLREEINNRLK